MLSGIPIGCTDEIMVQCLGGCITLVVWEAGIVKSNPETPQLGPIFFNRYDHKD